MAWNITSIDVAAPARVSAVVISHFTKRLTFAALGMVVCSLAASNAQAQEYDRLLVPIFVTMAPGQFQSQWLTEFRLYNASDRPASYYPRGCGPEDCSTLEMLVLPHGSTSVWALPLGPAQFVFLRRPEAADVHVEASLVAVGQGNINPGLAIPIVRDEDLRTGDLQILNVPGPSNRFIQNFRVSIRIFAVDVESESFRVSLFLETDRDPGEPLNEFVVTARTNAADPTGSLSPATVELFGIEKVVHPNVSNFRVEISASAPTTRFWAVASATNNDNQVVRLIPPSTRGRQ